MNLSILALALIMVVGATPLSSFAFASRMNTADVGCAKRLHRVTSSIRIRGSIDCDSLEKYFNQILESIDLDMLDLTCVAEITSLPDSSTSKQKLQRDYATTLHNVEIFKSRYRQMKQNCRR